jgi:hypothetical protein
MNWSHILGAENILIPRRSPEERQQKRMLSINRILNQKHIDGDLDLHNTPITDLGQLESVGGNLDLFDTPITNLGQLESVGGYLYLSGTPITNLGQLESVGGDLNLSGTPISEMSKEERGEILKNVVVKGEVYL